MDKDWFPFFSMLLWCATKIVGLYAILSGLWYVGTMLTFSTGWFSLGFVPAVLDLLFGAFLLLTDTVWEVASAPMRNRTRPPA